MLRVIIAVFLTLTFVGCAKKPFDPSQMTSQLPSETPEYKNAYTIESIEALKPQLKFPIVLAVSQPTSGHGWYADEIEIIESWEAPLKEHGFISELIVLPESFSKECGWRRSYFCGVDSDRKTAARFHADALLMMSTITETESYTNPMSILNLTIVGMWLAPGHHRDAHTIVEGSLIDNRNEYLYAFARAHGEEKKIRPYAFAEWRMSTKDSRIKALKAFGEKIISEIQQNPIITAKSS
jgi:rhombotail lipoprotein